MASKADLVGAIRLPDTAFKKNANTEVVTDILVFRKKDGMRSDFAQQFALTQSIDVDGTAVPLNEYFVTHPEMVMGTHSMTGSMYAGDTYTVKPNDTDLIADIGKAIQTLPADIAGEQGIFSAPETYEESNDKERLFVVKDGRVYRVENGRLKVYKIADTSVMSSV